MTGCKKICYSTGPAFDPHETPVEQAMRAIGPPSELPIPMQLFPYLPTQPEWKDIPWDAAREVNPKVDGFVGHDDEYFYFQERGNHDLVKVAK